MMTAQLQLSECNIPPLPLYPNQATHNRPLVPLPLIIFCWKTNKYFEFCQSREPDTGREKRHEAKGPTSGFAKFPEGGITDDDVYGMLGIVVHMGLVRTCRFANAWSLHPNYNFPNIRNCMPRDFWYLLYSRFLHFAPAGGNTGDKLHHIR